MDEVGLADVVGELVREAVVHAGGVVLVVGEEVDGEVGECGEGVDGLVFGVVVGGLPEVGFGAVFVLCEEFVDCGAGEFVYHAGGCEGLVAFADGEVGGGVGECGEVDGVAVGVDFDDGVVAGQVHEGGVGGEFFGDDGEAV